MFLVGEKSWDEGITSLVLNIQKLWSSYFYLSRNSNIVCGHRQLEVASDNYILGVALPQYIAPHHYKQGEQHCVMYHQKLFPSFLWGP